MTNPHDLRKAPPDRKGQLIRPKPTDTSYGTIGTPGSVWLDVAMWAAIGVAVGFTIAAFLLGF